MVNFQNNLEGIPQEQLNETGPYWNNGFFPGLDALALYCIMSLVKPTRYFEVGSGNSTMFARKAIHDHSLNTVSCV